MLKKEAERYDGGCSKVFLGGINTHLQSNFLISVTSSLTHKNPSKINSWFQFVDYEGGQTL